MKKWFISDTHFSHTNIIRYAGRPFETVEDMSRCLIKNWNDCIDASDHVFFLGDFGLGDVFFHDLISHQIRNFFDILNDKDVGIFQFLHAFLSLTNRQNPWTTGGPKRGRKPHEVTGNWRGRKGDLRYIVVDVNCCKLR